MNSRSTTSSCTPVGFRPADQAMGIQGVGRAADGGEIELDAVLGAFGGNQLVRLLDTAIRRRTWRAI